MKNSILNNITGLITVLTVSTLIALPQENDEEFQKSIFAKAQIRWKIDGIIPADIKFKNATEPTVEEFFRVYRKVFDLNDDNSFQLLREEKDQLGQTHGRYKQYYKGIEVAEVQFLLHSEKDRVQHAHGRIIHNLELDINPALDESEARKFAYSYLGISETSTENDYSDRELLKNLLKGNEEGILMISEGNQQDGKGYRLVFRFDLITDNPPGRFAVDIDAQTGELVGMISKIYTENISTTALSLYNDTVEIVISDTIHEEEWPIPKSHWHLDDWMAFGNDGLSWWVADTNYFDWGTYDVFWHEALETDSFILTGDSLFLTFYHRYAVEPPPDEVADYDCWDGMNVQISNDGGNTWNVLTNPSPDYPCSSVSSFGTSFDQGTGVPGWSDALQEWTEISFDLEEYKDDTVILRFVFGSDPNYTTFNDPALFGWQIDNILVSGSTGDIFKNNGSTDNISTKNLVKWIRKSEGKYKLRETLRGIGIATFDTKESVFPSDFKEVSFDTFPVIGDGTRAAVNIHHGMEKTYDYFLEKHGRNSYDNEGGNLMAYANWTADDGQYNAFWYGGFLACGPGDGTNVLSMGSLDVVGHEITHGVTVHSANLRYWGESGALNESFSDIFGTAIEFYVEGTDKGDWLSGEDPLMGNGAFRSLNDPNSLDYPDTYYGTFWANTGSDFDYGGVHINSSVQNYWFYLLSEGGTGTNDHSYEYEVSAIGLVDAEQIAYRNLTKYLAPKSGFADAAIYSVQAAEDLFGAGSQQVQSVTEAWRAVGLYFAPKINTVGSLEIESKVNSTRYKYLFIRNVGIEPLEISDIRIEGIEFTFDDLPELPVELAQAEGLSLRISYSPVTAGNFEGSVIIESNDPDFPTRVISLQGTGIEDVTALNGGDESFSQLQVYPNPFSDALNIQFTLDNPGNVYIQIVDASGKIITNLVTNQHYIAGIHTIAWNENRTDEGKILPGNYIILLTIDGKTSRYSVVKNN